MYDINLCGFVLYACLMRNKLLVTSFWFLSVNTKQTMKITEAIYFSFRQMPPSPSCLRLIMETVSKLSVAFPCSALV